MYKVIVVEDEDLIRKGLIFTFKWDNYNCVIVGEAENGLEGEKLIRELEPDIVITDVKMPIVDGIKMISKFKERDFEIIIISGYAEFEYARKALEYRVNDYLLKPIDHKLLETKIVELTGIINNKRTIKKLKEKVKDIKDYELINIAYFNDKNYKYWYTDKLIKYIDENLTDKITLENVAKHFKISKSKLTKEFKEETTHTFNDFLNRYRLQKAIGLMFSTDMLIYEIAQKVGYSDYKYFSGVFKNYVGYTPTEFLKVDTLFVKGDEN